MKKLLVSIIFFSICFEVYAEPTEPLVIKKSNKYTSVSNLPIREECSEDNLKIKMSGVITARDFEDDHLSINSFILEQSKGNRSTINVNLMDVARSWGVAGTSNVIPALQELLKIQRHVNVVVYKTLGKKPSCQKDFYYLYGVQ